MPSHCTSSIVKLPDTASSCYVEALKQGAAPAAYVRLMFIGSGGSGKSSLVDGLMNKPMQTGESTALADTKTVSYQCIKAADAAGEGWKVHSKADEASGLAARSRQIVDNKRRGRDVKGSYINDWAAVPAVKIFNIGNVFKLGVVKARIFDGRGGAINKIIETAKTGGSDLPLGDVNPDTVLHIWDCGGQPVFLDIISAFITPRTMFFLTFNASVDLNSKYQEKWYHNGELKPGRDQDITHLELMKQWLQLIHFSLAADERMRPEGLKSEAMACNSVLPVYPKAMLVGTHRDFITPEEATGVIDMLKAACMKESFGHLIVDYLMVDNTTAGKGRDEEDPGYQNVRENVHEFTQLLCIDTPLAWIAFRQEISHDNPIMSYDEAVQIAEGCGIPPETVPSMLHFYHQLGAMLYYAAIPLLSNTIIVEPQWLIEQLRKLFMPSWALARPTHLQRFWACLEERGVLLEELYQEIWKDCGLKAGAQGLASLLDHFDLAKEIPNCPHDMGNYEGKKYFVPGMLKIRPKGCDQVSRLSYKREAATLHILFTTGYVPPGFFVRLIARIIYHKAYSLLLDEVMYRDSITFKCNEIDRVTITESLRSIRVHFYRKSNRKIFNLRFTQSCLFFLQDITHMCKSALQWMPSVKVLGYGFQCACCDASSEHFVLLPPESNRESIIYCQRDNEYYLSEQHRFWLSMPPPIPSCVSNWKVCIHIKVLEVFMLQVNDGSLTNSEIMNVSKDLEDGAIDRLVKVMEMEYSLEKARMYSQNQERSLAYTIITDFAMKERNSRYMLAQFLLEAKLFDTHEK